MMKKILALLLTLALCLTLALPAFALEEGEPDPAMPVITAQPEDIPLPLRELLKTNGLTLLIAIVKQEEDVKLDFAFELSIAATIPNGDPVGYQWYMDGEAIEGAVDATYAANFKDFEAFDGVNCFTCVVYNAAQGADESLRVTSREVGFAIEVKGLDRRIGVPLAVLGVIVLGIATPFAFLLMPFLFIPMSIFIPAPLGFGCVGGIMLLVMYIKGDLSWGKLMAE